VRPLTFFLIFAAFLASIFTAGAQEISAPIEMPDTPEGQGVFCRIEASKWTRLEPATIADTKIEGMKRFLETVGLSNLYTTITYKGAKAKARVSIARPVFFVRGVGSAGNALIVRLIPKKDSRETYTESDNTTYDNKGGYEASDIRRLLITPYSKDAFSAAPEDGLDSGEYLLTFGNANIGYDFGVVIRGE
jgi:hypothetical protein